MLRLFDTARGEVVPFEPAVAGKVSMYVCGPTVYGPPHLGHGRFSLVFDVLRRYLEWSGYEVTYVSNITDVDDNIINKANEEGRTPEEVALHNEAIWWEAMDAIGVKRPTKDPHASAYIPQMVELVARLVDKGVAYETADGVYFQPSVVADYGLLPHQSVDDLLSGARVEVDEAKRSPIDFALWKKAKPGEPSWPSPWGPGRPGWHTECVVMSLDLLGEGFDIHGGGQDLKFPHHENERAQAVAEGKAFARHWVHNGFVVVDGEKMSKSLNNFTNLVDLIDKADPRAYRLLVLRSDYRGPVEVGPSNVADASAALARLDAFARRVAPLLDRSGQGSVLPDAATLDAFREAMDDDLKTPKAVDVLFSAVAEVHRRLDAGDEAGAAPLAAAAFEICRAVGLELDVGTGVDEMPDDVVALAGARDDARAAKDWVRADEIRNDLQARGYVVEDTPDGTHVRPA
jgi:cysteinyl-tRNA synthetase